MKKVLVLLIALFAAAFALNGCAKKHAAPPVDPGVEMFEAGHYDEAREHYTAKLAENAADAEAAIFLGRIALKQEDLDGAVEWMEKALEMAPDSSSTHYWAATAYVMKVQKQNAFDLVGKVKTHIEKAVELDPENIEARLFLAGFLMNAPPFVGGDIEKAKEQAEIIVAQDPVRGNMFTAEIYKKEKNFDLAAEAYAAAAAADPTSADPYYALGIMYQTNKDWDDAYDAFETAIEVDTTATAALYQIGRTGVFSEQDVDKAITALRKYLTREPAEGQPTWANARWRLGLLYEIEGDVAAARAEYEAALELNPEDENVLKELKRLDEAETPKGSDEAE